MNIYFIRHGESEANVLREFSNTGFKHPLTPRGVEQAQALAAQLAEKSITHIYSSPIMRAVQTAEIIKTSLKVDYEITEALREWSVGVLEGRRDDEESMRLHRSVREDWFLHGRFDSKIPEGESFNEIRARFVPFIHQVIDRHAPAGENVALVAHGGLYFTMLPLVFVNLPREFVLEQNIPNCAYILGRLHGQALTCVEWCGQPIG